MLRETVYTMIVAIGFYSPQGRNAKLETSVLGHIFSNFYIRVTFTAELTAVNLLSSAGVVTAAGVSRAVVASGEPAWVLRVGSMWPVVCLQLLKVSHSLHIA